MHQRHLRHIERHRAQVNAQFERQLRHINRAFDRQRERAERILSGRQEEIIQAGLQLLNEEGINELSLLKLAKKLNLQASALYWHFKSKEDLVDYIAEAILSKEFAEIAPRRADESWQDWLIALIKRLRNAMLAYRDGGRIVAGAHLYPAVTLIRLLEAGAEALTSAGLSESRAELIMSTATHFTFGRVIEEQSGPTTEEVKNLNLKELAKQFPHAAKGMQRFKNVKNITEMTNHQFEESLRLIIQ